MNKKVPRVQGTGGPERGSSGFDAFVQNSKSVAVCVARAGGEIVASNALFCALMGCTQEELLQRHRLVQTHFSEAPGAPAQPLRPGCQHKHLRTAHGTQLPVLVEVIDLPPGDQLWMVYPLEAGMEARNVPTEEAAHLIALQLLHDSVAQSIAALAMNLHMVKVTEVAPVSPGAEEFFQASIALVDQCSREVRKICNVLSPARAALPREAA